MTNDMLRRIEDAGKRRAKERADHHIGLAERCLTRLGGARETNVFYAGMYASMAKEEAGMFDTELREWIDGQIKERLHPLLDVAVKAS